jgi:hypothetical protein
LDILNAYPDELKNNFFFVKVFLSTFIPYPTKDIISKSDIKADTWEQMYQQLDYEALRSKYFFKFIIVLLSEKVNEKIKKFKKIVFDENFINSKKNKKTNIFYFFF